MFFSRTVKQRAHRTLACAALLAALALGWLSATASADSLSLTGDIAADYAGISLTETDVLASDVSPGATTYDIYFGSSNQYLVVGLETTSGATGTDFANLYFSTMPGSSANVGFEVNNQDAFIVNPLGGPSIVGHYDQTGSPNPDVGIRYLVTNPDASSQTTLEFIIPWTFFTGDPLGLGFTEPTTGVQFRTSQSFGDDFVGGGGTRFDPGMFGTVAVPTPEPASCVLLALGSLGVFALARRRRKA